jgi:hypothetical protein
MCLCMHILSMFYFYNFPLNLQYNYIFMFKPKHFQLKKNLHCITGRMFEHKCVLLLNFAFVHTCNLSTHVSPANNLEYFSFTDVCPIEVNPIEVYIIDIYHIG